MSQSEEQYRSLFDTMIEGFCLIEVLLDGNERPIDYRFLEINAAFEKLTGLRQAQGKLMRELDAEHQAHWLDIYGKVALTGEPARFVNDAEGVGRWYDVSAYRVGGSDSRKVGVLFNDISEVKRAEKAQRESERRYAALFANQLNGMAHCRTITDEDGHPVDYVILQVNEAYERIMGIRKAEIEGRRVTEVFSGIGSYALDYIGMYGKIALEGGETQFEEYFEATGQCLSTYAYGSLPGEFTAIFSDVTHRKRAEDDLRRSEERLALAASATRIGMFDWDLVSGRVLWTRTHEAIFGYAPAASAETASATTTASSATTTTECDKRRWSDRVHPEDLPLVEEQCRRCLQDGNPLVVQYRILWPDGSLHWVETKGVFLPDGNGTASRLLGIVVDITGRKLAEGQIEVQMEELRRLNAELTSFNSVAVGRELRMVELKRLINGMCVQAGQPQRYQLDFFGEEL